MNGKRIISSLLSLAMIFSLNTGMSFAEEAEQPVEEPVVEEQVVTEEPAAEDPAPVEEETEEPTVEVTEEEAAEEEVEAEEEYPAQTFTGITPDGKIKVDVVAGEGALPEGTTMSVENVNEAEIGALVDSVISGTRNSIVAADIIFKDKEGYDVEPLADVTITLENLSAEKFEDYSVVHINQAKEADVVKSTQILSLTDEQVVFTADVFSIYAIVDTGDTAEGEKRTTFKFLDQDGNPFYFINDHGQSVDNQILKNGESLQDVGLPKIDVQGDETFNGWYYWDEDTQTWGAEVSFGTPITVTATETRYIKANVGTSHYLTFHEDAATGSNVLTKKQIASGAQYDVDQQSVQVKESDLAFIGWSYDPFDGTDINDDTRTPISPSEVPVTEDRDLYPIFKRAYWLNFVSSQPGSGAQYVPSQYVLNGQTTVKPSDPTWTGYEFDYWSTTPHVYEGTGTKTRIVNDGSDGKYTFGQELTEPLTLYAYWKPAQTNYYIVYWKQNVTDDKNANDADKTYSYADMEVKQAEAFSTVTRPSSAETKNYTGFTFNETKSDTSVEVDPNGSSVINVYYDRQMVTMQFYEYYESSIWGSGYRAPENGYNDSAWTNGSDRVTTYTGLYGQTLDQLNLEWPEGIWTYYRSSGTAQMSYLGQFVLPENVRQENIFRAYKTSDSHDITVHFMLENVDDDDYKEDAKGYGRNVGEWTFSEKYDGFELYKYSTNGSTYYDIPGDKTLDVSRVDDLYIQYRRKRYTLKGLDPQNESTTFFEQTVKYGAKLANYKPTTDPECPYPGKKFEGNWYNDKTGTTKFDWANATMPNDNLNVYAKWDDIWYWIKVDPNGGVIDGSTGGATYFWETYGELVEEYGWIERNYVEDASGSLVYQYDEFNEKDPDGDQPTTRYAQYVAGSGSKTYKEEFGAYQLIGWYNVDLDSGEVTSPYNFAAPITDNVYIRAVWRKVGEYKLVYDANGGQDAPFDNNRYADGSDSVVLEECTPPADKVFVGWEYNGKTYIPGDVITIDADLATNKEITLTAVYKDYEDIPIKTTHINWYANKYDAAGFEIPNVDSATKYSFESDDTPYNELINIADVKTDLKVGNEYDGYTFLGWARVNEDITEAELKNLSENDLYLKYDGTTYLAKDKDGNWVEATGVGADENQPYHAMYAIWQTEFKVYHSGVDGGNVETIAINKTNLPNGTYDLTQNLTANTIYGGYYLNQSLDENSKAYDGQNYTWSNPQTVKGTAIVPTPGETYYIKEVPVTYLLPYLQYTYKKGENVIKNLYQLSAVDDLNYNSTGFEIVITNEEGRVYKAVTIKAANTGTSTRFTPENMFGLKSGWVSAFDATSYLENGSSISVRPYWVTPDTVTAYGNTQRNIDNSDGTITGFTYEDEIVGPSIDK